MKPSKLEIVHVMLCSCAILWVLYEFFTIYFRWRLGL